MRIVDKVRQGILFAYLSINGYFTFCTNNQDEESQQITEVENKVDNMQDGTEKAEIRKLLTRFKRILPTMSKSPEQRFNAAKKIIDNANLTYNKSVNDLKLRTARLQTPLNELIERYNIPELIKLQDGLNRLVELLGQLPTGAMSEFIQTIKQLINFQKEIIVKLNLIKQNLKTSGLEGYFGRAAVALGKGVGIVSTKAGRSISTIGLSHKKLTENDINFIIVVENSKTNINNKLSNNLKTTFTELTKALDTQNSDEKIRKLLGELLDYIYNTAKGMLLDTPTSVDNKELQTIYNSYSELKQITERMQNIITSMKEENGLLSRMTSEAKSVSQAIMNCKIPLWRLANDKNNDLSVQTFATKHHNPKLFAFSYWSHAIAIGYGFAFTIVYTVILIFIGIGIVTMLTGGLAAVTAVILVFFGLIGGVGTSGMIYDPIERRSEAERKKFNAEIKEAIAAEAAGQN